MNKKLVLVSGYAVLTLLVGLWISGIVFVAQNLNGLLLTFSHRI